LRFVLRGHACVSGPRKLAGMSTQSGRNPSVE
jgi:hypothetical protein